MKMLKSIFACMVLMLLLLPETGFAVGFDEIIEGLDGKASYTYENGLAVISGDTLTISGGMIEDAFGRTVSDAWGLNVKTVLFQNVKIKNTGGWSIARGNHAGIYRVEFDKNTVVEVEQFNIGTLIDDENANKLVFINNGVIYTTGKEGRSLVTVFGSGIDEVTFINNGTITTDHFFGHANDSSCVTIEQNGTLNLVGEQESFTGGASDEGVLNVRNTNEIIGNLAFDVEDSSSLSVNNSGSVSGRIYYHTDSDKNAMAFSHSGSVGEDIRLLLRGNYDFDYSNTGRAGKGMFLEVWGDTTVNGTHAPAAGTPEIETLYLYPYFTITSKEETLTKAKTMYDQLKHLGVDRMSTYDIFIRNRFEYSERPIQDNYKSVWCDYEFFEESRNQVYFGDGDLTFATTGDYNLLRRVTVDKEILPASAYTAWSGSTYIKLHEDYLKTLESGEHLLSVEYLGGNIRTHFTIDSGNTGSVEELPQTGDNSKMLMWLMMLSVSLAIMVSTSKKRKSI